VKKDESEMRSNLSYTIFPPFSHAY